MWQHEHDRRLVPLSAGWGILRGKIFVGGLP